MDVFSSLKVFGCLDTLPSRSNLDQDPLLVNTGVAIKLDDLLCFGNRRILVKGESSVHLGRNTTWNDLEDLDTKVNEEFVECSFCLILYRAGGMNTQD